jgi:hypothetical protein
MSRSAKSDTPHRQGGYLLVVAVVLIVLVAAMSVAVSGWLAANVSTSVNNFGSMQALYQAESGIEYGQRHLAVNLDWYRSDTDPISLPPQSLATGGFAASLYLPATMLRTRIPTATSTAAIRVYSTARFPPSGYLQIKDEIGVDAEFVSYSGISADTFTGIARNQSIGGVSGSPSPHERGSRVYPVTQLRTALAANCAALASIDVDAHSKFLGGGTIDIEGEELRYTSSRTSGGTLTLTGVERCQNGTSAAVHAIGAPVTPLRVDGTDVDFEAEIVATGTVGADQRISRRTVQR